MFCQVDDVAVHYIEHGQGTPVFALHGAGVDHREIEAALEPIFARVDGYRRIYPDLPGMGRTPATERLTGNEDVVGVLLGLVDALTDGAPFLLVGQSYGAYLARAVAADRSERAVGLALLCPLGEESRDVPAQAAVRVEAGAYEVLAGDDVNGYDDYFVVRTAATALRYRDVVIPGTSMVDETGLGRIFEGWALRRRPAGHHPHPTLIVAGRQDSTVGYAAAGDLLAHYPHASYAVLDSAGHALVHEQPAVLASLVAEWLERVEHRAGAGGPHASPAGDT